MMFIFAHAHTPPLDEPSDPTYLTAGFFDGSSGIGRHFSISYQNITFTDPVNPDTLTLTERFSTIRDNSYWLRSKAL